jgi:hypothetical protein
VLTQSTGAVVPAPDEPASGAIDMGAAASNRFSLLPWTTNGFVGLNLGRPRYDTGCGAGFDCGNPPISLHLYTGGMVTNYFGIELGYVDFNRAHRAGGETRAQGLDIDALARAPLGPLGVFAQAGATAGRTVVTAEPAAGLGTGREYGWGANYGAGASYNFLGNSSVVLQWDRNDFRFASGGRGVRDISLGYLYRF